MENFKISPSQITCICTALATNLAYKIAETALTFRTGYYYRNIIWIKLCSAGNSG